MQSPRASFAEQNWLPPTLVALCFLLGVMSRGLADAFSVFVLPISGALNADRAAVTGIYAIMMLGLAAGGPLTGYLFDRFGPLRLILLALLANGCGLLAASQAGALWHFYLALGLLGGIGCAALGSVFQAALLGRWFSHRLGTALSISYSANGIGVMMMAPLSQFLIDRAGWRGAYVWLGAITLVIVPLVLLLPWRRIAAGHPLLRPQESAPGGASLAVTRVGQAMRVPTFWILAWCFAWTSVGIYCLSPQLVALLVERGFTPLAAAGAVGVNGLLMPVGMIGFNWLADRGGRPLAVVLSYASTILGVMALTQVSGPQDRLLLWTFVALFGISMGSRGPMISTLATLRFRGPALGRIYGLIAAGMGLGGALGAWAGGKLHDLTGGYDAVLALSVIALGLGAIPLFLQARAAPARTDTPPS